MPDAILIVSEEEESSAQPSVQLINDEFRRIMNLKPEYSDAKIQKVMNEKLLRPYNSPIVGLQ